MDGRSGDAVVKISRSRSLGRTGIAAERATCAHFHHLILLEFTSPRHVLTSKSKVFASSRSPSFPSHKALVATLSPHSTHYLDQLPSILLPFVPSVNPHSLIATATKVSRTANMLRRPATTIQLTQADIEAYEANRQRRLWEKQQAQSSQASTQSSHISEKSQQASQKSKKDRVMGGR